MKIITISREFGSGGRELGKRLADELGFEYFDREIIARLCEAEGLDETYVERILEKSGWHQFPLTFSHSFGNHSIMAYPQIPLLLQQKKVIEEIAELGKDCVIVGRNADVILEEYHPYTLFVCADMKSRIERCRKRDEENLTDRQIKANIRQIDNNRSTSRQLLTDSKWGGVLSYQMTVNTSHQDIKTLAKCLAAYYRQAFEIK